MKKNLTLIAAVSGMLLSASAVQAQETVVVEDVTIEQTSVDCKDNYSCSWRDNWYLQLGAGAFSTYAENSLENGNAKHHITALYHGGFGHWFSPYLGFRFTGFYGRMHWDAVRYNKASYANANLDLTWDMLNSICGPNANRVFSIVPFVGVGGAYTWDYGNSFVNIERDNGHKRHNSLTFPASAGLQLRLRLCKYLDFFAEGRIGFYGDNFNNYAFGKSADVVGSVYGGFIINFGGRKYTKYNPCDYLSYISSLNNQVNALRGDLASTSAALAAAEAQLPCPEPVVAESQAVVVEAPLMATVRFSINSSRITDREMINVYNMAQWMKANPTANLVVQGYADKNTGSSSYNMKLSERRAQSVADALVNKYGIDPSRITLQAYGSDTQPYDTNNWNRIVMFAQP